MRRLACVGTLILLASSACDNKQDAGGAGAGASASAKPATTAVMEAGAAGGDAGSEAGAKVTPMPERPIPRPQTMVTMNMSDEVQMKASAYMGAMRAPHLDDAAADLPFANDLAAKLKPIVMSMDTGGDKARLNRVEVAAEGRQIDLLMAGGCDEKTPLRAVITRAGLSFATLASHGVLVVRCNDAKIQCLQSTRDPDDVLCTTAPRRK